MPGRQLYIIIQGDTVVAEIEQDTVWRVRLTTERFRTGDSLGVSTPAEYLTSRDGARALVGEGEIYLTIEEACGVSFRLDGVSYSNVARAPSPVSAVRLVPDTSMVDLVLLTPCTTEQVEVLTNSTFEYVLKHHERNVCVCNTGSWPRRCPWLYRSPPRPRTPHHRWLRCRV